MSLLKELERGLPTRVIGRKVRVYDVVTSTNDLLWELSDRGAEEGTAVFADGQTHGRGRLGRSWWSPTGKGIWMSVLLRPPTAEGAVPMTTIVGALATADAVRATTRLPALIRWPNDILVRGKKAAGVLVEARAAPNGRILVLGIGIDVNASRSEMPQDIAKLATSLSEEANEEINRLELAKSLLGELDRWYQIELEQDTETINQRWRSLSATLGSRIVLEQGRQRYEGTVFDVDVRFGLALRLDRGGIKHFRGEHVTVLDEA